MAKRRERLVGGLADGRPPRDFDPVQLKKGIEVEFEHTGDREVAMEIAMDHLAEFPSYYIELEKMEERLEKGLTEGAGALVVSEDTGRCLLGLRSARVHSPGEWGIFGGYMEPKHRGPAHCAHKERVQETGYKGPIAFIQRAPYRKGPFTFHNFIAIVPTEFEPRLNWEHDEARWFNPILLPNPLHVGVAKLIRGARALPRRD
jgi:8-oxo-dGTP pyrophosphatase MutT (NUDIX family)